MNCKSLSVVNLATLGLGTLVTGAAMMHAAGLAGLFSGFSALALSPYVVFCFACVLSRSSRGRAIAALVVSILATGWAIYFYCDLIFLHPGSMSGLVFLFVPGYQLPVAIVLLFVMLFTRPPRRLEAA